MNAAYQQTVFQVIPEQLPDSFCVITAWNPDGECDHPDANRLRDLELAKKIDSLALSKTRIAGMSPDESHGEPGWGVACSLDEGLELGREFQQEGIYFVDNDELNLIDCSDGSSKSLSSFSSRVRDPGCERCFVVSVLPPQGKERFQATEQLEAQIRVAKHFQRFTLRQAEETVGNRSTDILEISVTTHRTEDVIILSEDLLQSLDQRCIKIVHNGIAQRLHEWSDPEGILEIWGLS